MLMKTVHWDAPFLVRYIAYLRFPKFLFNKIYISHNNSSYLMANCKVFCLVRKYGLLYYFSPTYNIWQIGQIFICKKKILATHYHQDSITPIFCWNSYLFHCWNWIMLNKIRSKKRRWFLNLFCCILFLAFCSPWLWCWFIHRSYVLLCGLLPLQDVFSEWRKETMESISLLICTTTSVENNDFISQTK